MKLGIISYSFERESFEKVKALGLDFVEFCVNADADNRYAEFGARAAEIKKNLDELGLFTGSVGRWAGKKTLPDGSVNEAERIADHTLIEAAATLGCGVYVLGVDYVEELSLYENYTCAINYLSELIEFAKPFGIKIATCNCHWGNFIHSDPAWSVIHGHLNDLWIKYDPSHSVYANGENYLSEMKKWGKRFAHVHIKGSLQIDGERFDDPPAGLDGTNWGAFMAVLYANGYDGTLSIEPHSPVWQGELGDKGVEYTIKYIRSLMF